MKASRVRHTLDVVRAVLARDFACEESCFAGTGVFIREAREVPGRRRFPFREKSLQLATMGHGVVVACSADRLDWARKTLAGLNRDDLFSASGMWYLHEYVALEGQYLCGPDLRYICAPGDLVAVDPPRGVKVSLLAREEIPLFYDSTEFYNALVYDPASPRPDMAAAIATVRGRIVGMAGASADCEELWQIGVDVERAYRGRGLGKALVSRVTQAVFNADRIPYYTTAVGNAPSGALACSLGYRPAWTELYAQ